MADFREMTRQLQAETEASPIYGVTDWRRWSSVITFDWALLKRTNDDVVPSEARDL